MMPSAATKKRDSSGLSKKPNRFAMNNCTMEEKIMIYRKGNNVRVILFILLGVMFAVGIMTAMAAEGHSKAAQQPQGKAFSSPEEAAKALFDACKRNNTQELLTIFGPEGKDMVSSGDEVADKKLRTDFVQKYEEKNRLEQKNPGTTILCAGNDDWPLPIPIVKRGAGWYFDTVAGKEEILNRRIGRNELNVFPVMEAYVDAQHEYASMAPNGDGVSEFAQKFKSDEGKKNGLYWPVKEGEKSSPMGPFVTQAVKEGYKKKKDGPTPYHGYFFRILTGQGKNAPGGAYSYVVKKKMVLGFGLVAFPAEYRNSGVMTFIVNQQDIIYEKDLGPDTAKIAGAMKKYDPDKTWKKVEKTSLATTP
jgi:hypothetical protein